jgi:probable F420-dependent oxidoreductase
VRVGSSEERVSIVPRDRLAYGIQLPIQAQSSIFVEDWEKAAGAAELAAISRQADQSGFFYLAVCDHVAIPADKAEAMSTTWYDTMTTLGFLAGITREVRLLSHVYVPAYRHPLEVSKAFATLDRLSDGRAILGAGAGHVEGEFAALDVDFHRRGRLLDESIDAVRTAFLDEFPEHHGEQWDFEGLGQGPRPVQTPRPPIWIGGSSPAAIKRAAERGDGWLPQGNPPKKFPAMVASLLEQREAAVGDQPIDIGALTEIVHVGAVPDGLDVGPWSLSGEPEQIAEGLRRWGELGAHHIQFRIRSRSLDELLDQMEAFGRDVAPLLESPT